MSQGDSHKTVTWQSSVASVACMKFLESYWYALALFVLLNAISLGLNLAYEHDAASVTNVIEGPSLLFGLDAAHALMIPKQFKGEDACEIQIYAGSEFQLYQFADYPYRGDSKVINVGEFASMWDDGKSFARDPPNTAVQVGHEINFNTVEVTDVKIINNELRLLLRKPTNVWGGKRAEQFCKSSITTPISMFIDDFTTFVDRVESEAKKELAKLTKTTTTVSSPEGVKTTIKYKPLDLKKAIQYIRNHLPPPPPSIYTPEQQAYISCSTGCTMQNIAEMPYFQSLHNFDNKASTNEVWLHPKCLDLRDRLKKGADNLKENKDIQTTYIVTQSGRRNGAKVTSAVVTPVSNSNHDIGCAFDVNFNFKYTDASTKESKTAYANSDAIATAFNSIKGGGTSPCEKDPQSVSCFIIHLVDLISPDNKDTTVSTCSTMRYGAYFVKIGKSDWVHFDMAMNDKSCDYNIEFQHVQNCCKDKLT